MMTQEDIQALREFTERYPTWWWKIGWCDVTRDFDCAPQSHSQEYKHIVSKEWPDEAFTCDHEGTIADAIYAVMDMIDEMKRNFVLNVEHLKYETR